MSAIGVLIFAIGLILCTNALECDDSPIQDAGPLVTTESGKVLGKYQKVLDGKVAAFLGIPFAEPPLGQRRFTKPIPNQGWNGILETQHLPPPCMQYSGRNFSWVPANRDVATEDCLYLNLWVPMNRCYLEKLPVMVWIYGGGFSHGASGMDLYDGRVLASTGDVIVVSFNYRVGVFGYFNGGNDAAPGNAGLHDQVLALKWVQQNIEHFNGDRNSVTVFGESAGAMAVGLHLVSPLSRGLFHRAILQSGSPYQPYLVDSGVVLNAKNNKLAQMAGCGNETGVESDFSFVIECLKNKDAVELAKIEDEIISKTMKQFLPSLDNDFLVQKPVQSFDSGDVADVPVMIGVVSNETTIVFNYVRPDLFPANEPLSENATTLETARDFLKIFEFVLQLDPNPIFDYYFGNRTFADGQDIVRQTERALGDFSFYCPSMLLAQKTKTAFMYWMSHRSAVSPLAEWMGVPHFEDVQYVFGKPLVDLEHYDAEDSAFSADVIKKWTHFARTGSPGESSDSWPKFVATEPTVMELNGREPRLLEFPSLTDCEFWRPQLQMSSSSVAETDHSSSHR